MSIWDGFFFVGLGLVALAAFMPTTCGILGMFVAGVALMALSDHMED